MINVLITGGSGQLSQCFSVLNDNISNLNLKLVSKRELDISNKDAVERYFKQQRGIQYCINTAAYTQVDKAEIEKEKAFAVNAQGPKYLAQECQKHNIILIHISTDFVFDGKSRIPYKENDVTNPLNYYGFSKLEGEKNIQANTDSYYIIRTSWLYSAYGTNFVKTMLNLGATKKEVRVVQDQIGSPTSALDLAATVLKIINQAEQKFGIYHYANNGTTSWYDFAAQIFRESNLNIQLVGVNSDEYPTLAERPKYSVLNTEKIRNTLNIDIPDWKESLKHTLDEYSAL